MRNITARTLSKSQLKDIFERLKHIKVVIHIQWIFYIIN